MICHGHPVDLRHEREAGMLTEEELVHQSGLLSIHRANLRHLLTQSALYGSEIAAPLPIVNEIKQARENIYRVKEILRTNGIDVEDQPDDIPPIHRELDQIDGKVGESTLKSDDAKPKIRSFRQDSVDKSLSLQPHRYSSTRPYIAEKWAGILGNITIIMLQILLCGLFFGAMLGLTIGAIIEGEIRPENISVLFWVTRGASAGAILLLPIGIVALIREMMTTGELGNIGRRERVLGKVVFGALLGTAMGVAFGAVLKIAAGGTETIVSWMLIGALVTAFLGTFIGAIAGATAEGDRNPMGNLLGGALYGAIMGIAVGALIGQYRAEITIFMAILGALSILIG